MRTGRQPAPVWLKATLLVIALVGTSVAIWIARPNGRVFSAFEMHGGPVVIPTSENPSVIVLTSHREAKTMFTDNSSYTINTLHWDVWGLDANNLSRKWVTRLASVKQGALNLEAGIIGVSNGTAWLIADELVGVSIIDGKVIADVKAIIERNPSLQDMISPSKRQMYFDNGLVLVAANGKRWRIDARTLLASEDTGAPAKRGSVMEFAASSATDSASFLPMRLHSGYQSFKSRDYVVGDTWYGMMHPSEIELQRRDPHTQDFGQALSYRLWFSPLRDTVNRFRDPVRIPWDFAPLPASPEFLAGGLLTAPDRNGRDGVVGIAKPTRFLVLHQDRIDSTAIQTLTCIRLDGRVCWDARLGMSIATGFAMLAKGGPERWGIIVVGERRALTGESPPPPSSDGMPLIARVAVQDGSVSRMEFATLDFAKLSDELKPYRKR